MTIKYNIQVALKSIDRSGFLKVKWLNTPPEDNTGVLKHVGVEILWSYFH